VTSPGPPSALITGANRGLGRRTAELLCRRGWLVLLGCRDVPGGEAAAAAVRIAGLAGAGDPAGASTATEAAARGTAGRSDAVRAAAGAGARGGTARVVRLDVADAGTFAAAVERARQLAGGRLTALVNNAGVFLDGPDERLATLTAAACQEIFAVNAIGPVLVTQAMLPLLRAGGAASVVNVSSDDAYPSTADGTYTCYRMSKAALNMMTTNLAIALRPDGIAVNSVDPGWIPTDMGGPEATDDLDAAAELVAWAAALPVTAPGRAPSGEVFCAGAPPWSAAAGR
jgi:NAD(P)-dependent dehydrogenase (short-subunit alcohol dehydrogenase family)